MSYDDIIGEVGKTEGIILGYVGGKLVGCAMEKMVNCLGKSTHLACYRAQLTINHTY